MKTQLEIVIFSIFSAGDESQAQPVLQTEVHQKLGGSHPIIFN